MSAAVICDGCGKVYKRIDVVKCADALLDNGKIIYGADISKECDVKFDFKYDNGWHATPKKGGAE